MTPHVLGEKKYRVFVEAFFEAAHNLRSYKGKPEPLHGHSWKVEVEIETAQLDGEGMAIDFIDVKNALNGLIQKLDYTYINEVPPFTDIAPSAENIAQWIFDGLIPVAKEAGCNLKSVRVFEGRHFSASYGGSSCSSTEPLLTK